MSYYKERGRLKRDIEHFLKTGKHEEWQATKNMLLYKYDMGELTINRLLAIFRVREGKDGGLESVDEPTDGAVPTARSE